MPVSHESLVGPPKLKTRFSHVDHVIIFRMEFERHEHQPMNTLACYAPTRNDKPPHILAILADE